MASPAAALAAGESCPTGDEAKFGVLSTLLRSG
jgi:hypothetical protein